MHEKPKVVQLYWVTAICNRCQWEERTIAALGNDLSKEAAQLKLTCAHNEHKNNKRKKCTGDLFFLYWGPSNYY